MTEKNTGGPAFASGYVRYSRSPHDPDASMVETDRRQPLNKGLSLRDYFAAKAMQTVFAVIDIEQRLQVGWMDELAHESYMVADAMLKAREA